MLQVELVLLEDLLAVVVLAGRLVVLASMVSVAAVVGATVSMATLVCGLMRPLSRLHSPL